ncbi:uncharacterized protein LOC121380210 [Gigantopelta aegis]|uniref:uncharacterized protein LOC121380210 n=1 Tax=Gigantopelta aegis TaxID=1735272 RepID=UPI001B8875BD|nr:uncharacterized protein LOC121380210 [Gigantopelta aegis]
MQTLLSGQDSFLYGASMHNQRIESFWCILRKECAQFWMDTLRALKDQGDFIGDATDTNLIQFCFSNLVQNDLDRIVTVWNSHRIRPSKNENVPHGRPMVLYSMPEVFSVRNYMRAVNQTDVDICRTDCLFRDEFTCDQEMFELLLMYMLQYGLEPPTNAQEGVDLYLTLKPLVLRDLFDDATLLM